jgi:hypothetical protein
MGRECRSYGKEQECIKALEGKPEAMTLLGRPKRRMLDNTKKNLGKNRLEVYGLIDLAQDRSQRRILVNIALNLRVP